MRLAADQETTEEWWETMRHEYELFTSEVVEVEASEGDAAMAEARLRALDGIPRLPAQPEVDELIEHLLGSQIIPANAAADAAHIAFVEHALHELREEHRHLAELTLDPAAREQREGSARTTQSALA